MTDKSITILVTGLSGDLGQAILKSIRLMDRPVEIIGCDAAIDGIGAAFTDKFFKVPRADDPGYYACVAEICFENNVHAIIPGSEPEILALSRALSSGEFEFNAKLICQEYSWLKTYGDKLACFRALSGIVRLADFADGKDNNDVRKFIAENKFPCIVKSRFSYGSKSMKIAYDEPHLYRLLDEISDPVVQTYIDDKYGEFSIGVFVCDGFSSAVAFKRYLGPVGNSWYADNLVEDDEVLKYAYKIAEKTGLQGSCNIQVRKNSEGIRLLEINPRFSSLVAARAVCGFKDLQWSLEMALGEKIEQPKEPFIPLRFMRYFHEVVDFGHGYTGIYEWLPRISSAKNIKNSQ
jgi:carbamoyl-phosphate synthase large subunit